MQNVAFIINPFSAKKNYKLFLNKLQKKVEHPNFYISESLEGTNDFIKKNFEKIDIFVAVGGDGTISSVAKHLISTDKILAIFPAGSGNGFSRETNFGKNIDQLLEKIKTKKFQEVDTITINEHFCVNVSGAGFDGEVVKNFEKTNRGLFNYVKVSLQTFFKYKPIEIRFSDEKFQKFDGKYLMLNIANTRQFGNNAYIAPKADVSDGLAEIVLVKKFPFIHSPTFAFRMFTKKLKAGKYLKYISTGEIELSASTENWHIDGEFCKIPSPVNIKILPKSLKVLV
ncbi:MAG: diacylglycerol kinase [Flavobacteriaceae bacterium]|jgi:YegS/Rv2252/BmrU family lipid kinase|nr:diacylglycerol kinase [Flavobacteriaceae bacterium]